MGMYSFFDYEDIEVLDMEGLRKAIIEFKKHFPNSIVSYIEDDKNKDMPNNKMIRKESEVKTRYATVGEHFTFEDWDNIKLITYWSVEDVLFFDMIAPYIEGEVHWTFETGAESGYVEFINGKAILQLGEMKYTAHPTREDLRFVDKIPEALEQMRDNALLLRSIEEEKEEVK